MSDPLLDTSNNIRTKGERTTDTVETLLTKRLPANAFALQDVLRETEGCYIGIVSARVEAQAKLQNMRLQFLHPKDSQYTDYDRKIMLDAHTSENQAAYEQLAGIERALEQRIAVIQALLIQ